MPYRDAAENLPIEKGEDRADPSVVAQGREGFTDAHHVGFRDAYIQRPTVIDGRYTRLQATSSGQIGIDRNDTRIVREDLHGGRYDVAGAIFLGLIHSGRKGCD